MTASSFHKGKRLKPLLLALALCAGLHTGTTLAQTTSAPQTIDIPAGNMSQALDRLGEQTGVLITYEAGLVQGLNAPRVSGQLSPGEALRRLLTGSGILVEAVNERTFVLRRAPATNQAPPAGQPQQSASRRETREEPETQDLERISVTGTRIRGGSTPSPVITIDSERIREEGLNDLGEVIRNIPQNFRGGQNPGAVNGSNVVDQNITGGSALNLRGLGPDASLTLLNGHRMSYGGFSQAVDISAIPVEAVDRVEIVADGASAIYGSDAVGGVGNVILKRDFDGVALGVRYGAATDGGLSTREYRATAGAVWSGGGMIATIKDVSTDPLYARQRDYTADLISPRTIYPGSDLRSGLVSLHHAVGDIAELKLDALRTRRRQTNFWALDSYYNHYSTRTLTTLVSPGIDFRFGNDWTLSFSATRSKDETVDDVTQFTYSTGTSRPLASICYCNEGRSYEGGAEGPLFRLGGGDARLAVGLGYRHNDYTHRSTTTFGDSEGSRFGYAEINLPFVGPESKVAGVHRLSAIAALRTEDYDTLGRVTTPKFGVLYDPGPDLTLKASWGKSFKGPTLNQRGTDQYGILYTAGTVGGSGYPPDATVLMELGGNPDLEAERARTWTATMALHPVALPGLDVELSWFWIDYTDRVTRPMLTSIALSTPAYAEFITYDPTLEQQAEILAIPNFVNVAGAPHDPGKVVAILHNKYTNLARQRVEGVDLSGSYRFDLGGGRLTVRGSATWLDSSQQNSAGTSSYSLSGTIFNPARLNSRVGAVWGRGGFTASAFANYTDSVDYTIAGRKESTGSFTTVDATVRYGTGPGSDLWSDLEFALSTRNLLDRPPPSYVPPSTEIPPYDSLNYSPTGRQWSFSVSKRW